MTLFKCKSCGCHGYMVEVGDLDLLKTELDKEKARHKTEKARQVKEMQKVQAERNRAFDALGDEREEWRLKLVDLNETLAAKTESLRICNEERQRAQLELARAVQQLDTVRRLWASRHARGGAG